MVLQKKRFALLIVVLFSFSLSLSYAHDVEVHKVICERASEQTQILRNVLVKQLGLHPDPGKPDILDKVIGTKSIKEGIAFGGAAEDYGKKGEDDFWTTRGYNHFHDPLKTWNDAGFDSALNVIYWFAYGTSPASSILWALNPGQQAAARATTGDWSWGKAREYYYIYLTGKDFTGSQVAETEEERKSNFADCFRALGQLTHLLQDASVPAHTRNDLHIFPLTKNPLTGQSYDAPIGRWTYETYASQNKGSLKYSAYYPDPALLITPNPEQEYTRLCPISGLFDRNQYNGSTPPVGNDQLGLAEYTNVNFLSEDTKWDDWNTYPYPSLAQTNYNEITWWSSNNVEQVDAEDGKTDNRIYVKLNSDGTHLAAAQYWTEEFGIFGWDINHAFSLDERCWKDYADKLIPRAVGYSAALLDYFFRGTMEISAPDAFLYSIIDGSVLPQNFGYIKAKVKNTTSGEDVGPGTLVTVAKYKKRTNYQPDLSTDPPSATSREPNFSYSVSEPIDIDILSSEESTEFTFDFSDAPIPAGITDLYLQVIFKGTLGNEREEAIAVGMEDLNEPMHVVSWNSTDRFYLYRQLYTPQQIRSNQELLDLLPPGFNIDPYNALETGAAFYLEGFPENYNAYTEGLPSARFSRIIILTDMPSLNIFVSYYSASPPKDTYFEECVDGVINQEDESGNFLPAPVYSFRGIKAHLYYTLWNFFPDNVDITSAPWPPGVSLYPVPTDIYP